MCMLQNFINLISLRRIMPTRSRLVTFFLMPIMVFLGCVGWILYWVGSSKQAVRPRIVREANELTFEVLLPENKIEV